MTSMRSAIFDTYGDAGVLRVAQVPRPELRPTECLLRAGASSINPADIGARSGLTRLIHGRQLPHIPGYDVAGEIVACGDAVTAFVPGERVFALVGLAAGAQAEYVAVDQRKLARMPTDMPFVEAAVVPLAGLTALQALRGRGRIRSGQRVLITGAAGGVGSFAVQLGKIFGCHVTAVCRAAQADFVRGLGADDIFDYTHEQFTDSGRRWDVVFDAAAAYSFAAVRAVLAGSGTMVSVRPLPRDILAGLLTLSRGPHYRFLITRASGQDLALLAILLERGALRPVLDRRYTLDQLQDAHRYFEAGGIQGKVGIQIEQF